MNRDTAAPAASRGEGAPELVTFPKESTPIVAPMPLELPAGQSSSAVKALRWLIALIAIVAVGWGAYNYGYPALRAMNTPSSQPSEAPAPIAPEAQPTPTPAAPAPATSLFKTPATSIVPITADLTPSGIISAIAEKAKMSGADAPAIWEFSLNGPNGLVSFPDLVTALIPEAGPSGLAEFFATGFDPAFTSYVFHDDKGSWPGYVLKIKDGGPDIITVADRLQKLESVSYSNFFLSSPGAGQEFRTGQVKEKYMNRFIPLSTPGASFNYGIFGQYVIVNTSYAGLLKAIELLAL